MLIMNSHRDLFKSNLEFVQSVNPSLADKLAVCSSTISIVPDQSGHLVLTVGDECWSDSIVEQASSQWSAQWSIPDRVLMARITNDQIDSSIDRLIADVFDTEDLVMLSNLPNLRYQSDKSAEKSLARDVVLVGALSLLYLPSLLAYDRPESIVLVESQMEQLAAALHLVDFRAIILELREKNIGFHLIYECSVEALQAGMLRYYGDTNPLAVHGLRCFRSFYLCSALIQFHAWLHAPDGLMEHFKGFLGNDTDEINQTIHSVWNTIAYPSAHCLRADCLRDGDPIVIVASGPSLDEQIDWLRDHHHDLTIISAGSALGALLRAGIHVDGAVLLEMGTVVFRDLSDLLIEGHDLGGTVLFASITIDPRIAAEFKQVVFFHRPLSSAFTLYPSESTSVLPQAGPQAANAALEVALQLGTRRLLLLGCDFAAADPRRPRAEQAIGRSDRRFDLPVPGRLGKTVFSSAELSVTHQLFENALRLYGAHATTLGNGSRLEGVRSLATVDDLLDLQTYFSDPSHFHNLVAALPLRAITSQQLITSFKGAHQSLVQATLEIRSHLKQADRWTHQLSKELGRYTSWDDQDLDPPARLCHRLTRFLYFFVFQPLHDLERGPEAWQQHVTQAEESLLLIEKLFSAFFDAMDAICIAPRLPSFDPQWIKKRLAQSARDQHGSASI